MRASSISISRSAGRGIRGRRCPYGSGGGVNFGARIARRFPLPLEADVEKAARAPLAAMAASLVVAVMVISPEGSAWTVTASDIVGPVAGRGPLDCCISDHCATAQGEAISRP